MWKPWKRRHPRKAHWRLSSYDVQVRGFGVRADHVFGRAPVEPRVPAARVLDDEGPVGAQVAVAVDARLTQRAQVGHVGHLPRDGGAGRGYGQARQLHGGSGAGVGDRGGAGGDARRVGDHDDGDGDLEEAGGVGSAVPTRVSASVDCLL